MTKPKLPKIADKKSSEERQPEDRAGERPESEVCEVEAGTHPPPKTRSGLLAAPSVEVCSGAEEGTPAEDAQGGAPPPAESGDASPTEETPVEADAGPELQPVHSRHLVSSAVSWRVSVDPSGSGFCVFERIDADN